MTMPQDKIAALADSLSSLGTALQAASSCTGGISNDPRDLPVRQALQRCADLGRGCASLGRESNSTALAILARATLENLILILWVTLNEQNALDLQKTGIAELTRIARINLETGKAQILNRVTGADVTTELLADDRFQKLPKRKSVEAKANEAGVLDLYNIFYRFLSLDTHGHDIKDKGNSTSFELSLMHMQGIGAILGAAERVGTLWLGNHQRVNNDGLRKLLGLP